MLVATNLKFLCCEGTVFHKTSFNTFGSKPAKDMWWPSLLVEEDKLRFLVDTGFKVADIAMLFGVSKRTIERRLNYHLSTCNYSVIMTWTGKY